jgi:hypothetical protein
MLGNPDSNGERRMPPERPRSEPEILPPDRGGTQAEARIWTFSGSDRRIYLARPGPFAIVLALLAIGLVAALVLIVLLGLVVLWIPVLVIAIVAAVLGHYWRRWRAS